LCRRKEHYLHSLASGRECGRHEIFMFDSQGNRLDGSAAYMALQPGQKQNKPTRCHRAGALCCIVSLWLLAMGMLLASQKTSRIWAQERLSACETQYYAYSGRWVLDAEVGSATAEWPCTSVSFYVQKSLKNAAIELLWHGVRVQLRVQVRRVGSAHDTSQLILVGRRWWAPWAPPIRSFLRFRETGTFLIELRKMTAAAPYNLGFWSFLEPSRFVFLGVAMQFAEKNSSSPLGLLPLEQQNRAPHYKIEFIGASDTAGFCVSGAPADDTPVVLGQSLTLVRHGWRLEDCTSAYPAVLAQRLNAEFAVEALAGLGVYQNAAASRPWEMGTLTMVDFWPHTLQTSAGTFWSRASEPIQSAAPSDASLNGSAPPRGSWTPNLVLISLGGNDFNHQASLMPSDEDFAVAYRRFLTRIFQEYRNAPPAIVNICGQGSPLEANFDADNNRCRPCEHVRMAIEGFRRQHPSRQVFYIFVPCDGSVVTGLDDIGCAGHKNALGQRRVAAFLEPHIRKILHNFTATRKRRYETSSI